MLFLPYTPEEVMEETETLLSFQHRENKPSAWVFNELITWEDRNKGRVGSVYGKYYHIASQARRVSDQEISLEEMRDDLQELYGKYWSPIPTLLRFLVNLGKILAVALIFMLVGLAHFGLSLLVGNVLAASIVIGILVAILLVPQGVHGIWIWYRKRVDAMSAVYHRTVAMRLRGIFSSRCPQCGKSLDHIPPDKDGFIRCECGYSLKGKINSSEKV
jgi:hypothetical protein